MSEHVQNADTKNAAAEKSNVEVSVNDERAQRRARRQALLDSGINPYPIQSDVTAHVSELEDRYVNLENGESTEDEYSVAGRVRAIRNQGKIAFVVIEDYTGQLQLFCRINNLDEASWDLLGMLDLGYRSGYAYTPRPAFHCADSPCAAFKVAASLAGKVPRPYRS